MVKRALIERTGHVPGLPVVLRIHLLDDPASNATCCAISSAASDASYVVQGEKKAVVQISVSAESDVEVLDLVEGFVGVLRQHGYPDPRIQRVARADLEQIDGLKLVISGPTAVH